MTRRVLATPDYYSSVHVGTSSCRKVFVLCHNFTNPFSMNQFCSVGLDHESEPAFESFWFREKVLAELG